MRAFIPLRRIGALLLCSILCLLLLSLGVRALSLSTQEAHTPGDEDLALRAAGHASDAASAGDHAQPHPTASLQMAANGLSLAKTADRSLVEPGGVIVYTITLSVSDGISHTEVYVRDSVPSHTHYMTGSALVPAGFGLAYSTDHAQTWSGTSPVTPALVTDLRWYTPTIGAGSAFTLGYRAQVEEPLSESGVVITNQAQISSTQSPLLYSNEVQIPTVDLVVDKVYEGPVVVPGQSITYTITYSNDGSASGVDAVITDTVPALTTFDASASTTGWSCSDGVPAGTACTFSIEDLAAEDSNSIEFVVVVTSPFPAGIDTLNNTVILASELGTGVTDTIATPVTANSELVVTKTNDRDIVRPGDVLTYTITISNVGDQAATGILLTDTLTTHVGLVAGSVSEGEIYNPASHKVTWSIADPLAGGTFITRTFQVTVFDILPAGLPVIVNTVSVASDGVDGDTPEGNTAVDSDALEAAPDLAVTKEGSLTTASPGDVLTYTLAISNAGNQGATGVLVADALPDHTELVSASHGGLETPPYSRVVIWPVFGLQGDHGVARTIAVRIDDPLPSGVEAITNTVTVADDESNGPDLDPTDNTHTYSTSIDAAPDLVIVKSSCLTSAVPGDVLAYTIVVSNVGNQGAVGVIVTDTLPDHTTFSSASGGGVESPPHSGVVKWPGLSLPAGQSFSRVLTITMDSPVPSGLEEIANTASVTDDGSNGPDLEPENNVYTCTRTVDAAPNLLVTKDVSSPTVVPGELLTYTLTIANAGNQGATGVAIADALPDHTVFVDASDSGNELTPGSGIVAWPELALATVDSVTRTLTIQVVSPVSSGVEAIANIATVTDDRANGPDLDASDNTYTHTTALEAAPDLVIGKVADAVVAVAGGTVTYTITIWNVGNQGATGVSVTDVLPDHTSFVSASGGGTEIAPGGIVTWPTFSLDGEQTVTHSLTIQVDDPVPSGVDFLTNTCGVADDGTNGPDLRPDDNAFVVTTTLDAAPDLVVTKSTEVTTTVPGDVVTYTIVISNVGNQGTREVTLTDILPDHTTFHAASDGGGESEPGTVTWPASDLAAGEYVTRTLAIHGDNPLPSGVEEIVNTASVTDGGTDGPDLFPGNNSFAHTLIIEAAPDLAVTKDSGVSTAWPGDTLTYTIIISNVGTQEAMGVVIADALPDYTEFVTASNGGRETPPGRGVVIWPAFALKGQESRQRTLVLRAISPMPSGVESIDNVINVTDDGENGSDLTPGDNTYVHTTTIEAAPDLLVTKAIDVTSASPGDILAYTLTISNVGSQEATNVAVTDMLPEHTTFVSASDGGHVTAPHSGTVTWPDFDLVAGSSATRRITITIDSPLPSGVEEIVNTATVTDDGVNGPDLEPGDNTDTDTITVEAAPELVITKTNGVTVATPGDLLTYTLTISNVGNQGATGVAVTDTLPDHTTFVGTTEGGAETMPGVVVWPAFSLGGQTSITRTVTVVVHDPVDSGLEEITNEASVTDDGTNGPDPSLADNHCIHTTAIAAAPDLEISKTNGVTTAMPGDVLTYTITISNSGNQHATQLALTDVLPQDDRIVFVNASDQGFNVNGVVVWFAFDLLGGETKIRTVTIRVKDTVPSGVQAIANTATIRDNGDNGPDPTPGNNVYTHTTAIHAAPDLVVTKDNNTLVAAPGDVLTYTLTIRNAGSQDASSVVVTDMLPQYTTFLDASPGADRDGRAITWTIGSLYAGSSRTRIAVVSVDNTIPDDVGVITNTATVVDDGSNGLDLTPGDNVYTHTTVVSVAPDLSVTKDAGTSVTVPGDVLTYTLTIRNTGTQDATGVVVTDTLPDHTSLLAVSADGAETAPESHIVTWPTLDLNGRQSVTRTVTVEIDAPLPAGVEAVVNTAIVADDGAKGPDPLPDSNRYDLTTGVDAAPDLVVTKTNGVAATVPGDTLTYTITVSNTGDQGANDIVVTDTLPAHTTFVGASGDGQQVEPGVVVWPPFDLAAGEGTPRTVVVQVDNPLSGGVETIVNRVVVADDGASGPDRDPGNNAHSQTTTVYAVPDLVIAKDTGVDIAVPGDILTYTITIQNVGNQNATKLTLVDQLPAHTTFRSASNGYVHLGGYISWVAFDLNGGETITRTATIRVHDPLPSGVQVITNSVTVQDDGVNGLDPTPENNTDVHVTVMDAVPDLVITQTNDSLIAAPGDLLTYAITISNEGSQDARGIVVTAVLPDHTGFDKATGGGAHAGGVVTWLMDSLNAGTSRDVVVVVKVVAPLPEGVELITNTVAVSDDGTNGPDLHPDDNICTHTMIASAAPDLIVVKGLDRTVAVPGEILTYTLLVRNKGNQNATGLALVDRLPAHTALFSASDGGTEDPPGIVTWPRLDLPGGETFTYTIALTMGNPLVSGVEALTNTAVVSDDGANGPDPTPEDNTSLYVIAVDAAPDLVIRKTNDLTVTMPGDILVYVIEVSNVGTQDATEVRVTDVVPDHTTFLSASDGGDETPPGSSNVAWPAFDLNGGAPVTRTITLQVNEPLPDQVGALYSTATVADDTYNGPDLNPGDNQVTVVTPITRRIFEVHLPTVLSRYRSLCTPFFDGFDDPGSGWPTRNDAYVQMGYRNGEYQVWNKTAELRIVPSPAEPATRYVLETDARWSDLGDEYGLIFGLSDPLSSQAPIPPYYRFVIDPVQQRYRLKYYDGQDWECVNQAEPCWVDSPHIRAGSARNSLKVECTDTAIALYVNEEFLWQGPAPYSCSGWVGVETQSLFAAGAEVHFDNFRVGCSAGSSSVGPQLHTPQAHTVSMEPDVND